MPAVAHEPAPGRRRPGSGPPGRPGRAGPETGSAGQDRTCRIPRAPAAGPPCARARRRCRERAQGVGQATALPSMARSAAGSRTVKRAPATPGMRRSRSSTCSSCAEPPPGLLAVARPDAAAVGIDDLARDAQAQPGVLADRAVGLRPVGIEALEDVLELVRGDAGPVVLHDDLDLRPDAARRAP